MNLIDPDPKTVAVRMEALAKEGLTAASFGLSEHQLRHHLDPCHEPELFELVKMDPVGRKRLWEWLSAEHKAAAPRSNGHDGPTQPNGHAAELKPRDKKSTPPKSTARYSEG